MRELMIAAVFAGLGGLIGLSAGFLAAPHMSAACSAAFPLSNADGLIVNRIDTPYGYRYVASQVIQPQAPQQQPQRRAGK